MKRHLHIYCSPFWEKPYFLLGSELLQLKWLLGKPALHHSQLQAASLSWCRHCICKATSPPLCLFFLLGIHLLKSPPGRQACVHSACPSPTSSSSAAGEWGQIPEGESKAQPLAIQSNCCCGKKSGSEKRMIYWHKLSQYKHLWYRCLCSKGLPALIQLFCKLI